MATSNNHHHKNTNSAGGYKQKQQQPQTTTTNTSSSSTGAVSSVAKQPAAITKQPQLNKKKAKNKKSFKTVLDSSLNYQWPLLSSDQTVELLMLLKDKVVPSMATITATTTTTTATGAAATGSTKQDDQPMETVDDAKKMTTATTKKKERKGKQKKKIHLGDFVMSGFYLGINEVTKAMEENKAKLVVVCKDVAPVIIQHLPILAFLQKIPFCAIQTTNQTTPIRLGEIFGLKSVIAFAVSEEGEPKCQELIHFVKNNAATLSIPWLASTNISYRPLKLIEVGPKRLQRVTATNSNSTPKPPNATKTSTTSTTSSTTSTTSTTT